MLETTIKGAIGFAKDERKARLLSACIAICYSHQKISDNFVEGLSLKPFVSKKLLPKK